MHLKLYLLYLFILTAFLFIQNGCKQDKIRKEKKVVVIDSLTLKDSLLIEKKPELKITYHKYPSVGLKTLRNLRQEYGFPKRRIILALNRIDHDNVSSHDTLMIPDTVSTDIMIYSPFPPKVKILDSVQKILLFSYPIESFAAYQNGILVRWGPTSLGKKSTPTPEGLYFTNWKKQETISTEDSSWILPWYFNIENKRGISLHQFSLPGYPASHACARLLLEDAEWIYHWAEQWIISKDGEKIIADGTPVIIFGRFNYKVKPLWKRLADDPHATDISESSIDSTISPFLHIIRGKREIRDSVLTARNKLASK
ncbi:MAG: L,D-transpeptidase [Ignavibacteriaceae bacterium]